MSMRHCGELGKWPKHIPYLKDPTKILECDKLGNIVKQIMEFEKERPKSGNL